MGTMRFKAPLENIEYVPAKVFGARHIQELSIPIYPASMMEPCSCSMYARLAAKVIFNKEYSKCAAWNRRYQDSLVDSVKRRTLFQLAREEILTPGMIVGIENPFSTYLSELDQTGKKVKYTHVALYLGFSREHEPLLAEQYGDEFYLRTERDLKTDGLTPLEIIDANPK